MASKNEAKITFKADTSDLDAGLKAANSSMKELRGETKLVEEQMRTSGESAEGMQRRQQLLAQQLDQAGQKTELLRQKLAAAEAAFGADSAEAQKLRNQLNYAQIEEEKLKQSVQEANAALEQHKNRLREAGAELQEAGGRLEEAGAKASVMSAAVAAAGKAALDAYKGVESGANNVVRATGATGQAAQELEAVYKDVASEMVGDFEEIGSAVGEVQTRFGYTGDRLKEVSEDFLRFSEVTGVDAVNGVKEVSRIMNAWEIDAERYPLALDQVTLAAQATGISAESLLSSLDRNGTSFRELGFDVTSSIAILAEFEREGVDTSTAMTGMRKAVAEFAKEGKDASTGFSELFDGIRDGTVSAADAMDVFGTKGGPALVEAIRSGRFEFEGFSAALEGAGGTVSSTFDEVTDGAYRNELAMQNMQLAAAEVGQEIQNDLTPVIDVATGALRFFSDLWGMIPGPARTAIVVVGGILAVIGPLVALVGSLASAMGTAMSVAGSLFSVLAANPIVLVIAGIVALLAALKGLYDNCAEFRAFIDGMWASIQAGISATVSFFQGFGSAVTSVVSSVAGFISSMFADPFGTLRSAVTGIIDWVRSHFKLPQITFPSIPMPHFRVYPGEFPWGIGGSGSMPSFSVKWYKTGGIFDGPSIIGVGEAGREAVLPLEGRYMKPFADAIAEGIGGGSQTINVYVTADSSTTLDSIIAEAKRASLSMRRL